MKTLTAFLSIGIALISQAAAQQSAWGQCGGMNWSGPTTCVSGYTCVYSNPWYSQCLPGSGSGSTTTTSPNPVTTTTGVVPGPTSVSGMEGYAALGGTTGGAGGSTVRVSSLSALTSAVSGSSPKIVIITSSLSGNTVVNIGSNKSVYGANSGITLNGIGLRVKDVSNVIIRNLKISKVLSGTGDAIGIQEASKVWVDHVDVSSDMDHNKDYYDGLIDITHGCTYVTVSWSKLHDHWKTMLIGHSDSNGSEDRAMTVTVHHNWFQNLNSRGPSFRFGTGHVYNNLYSSMKEAVHTRQGAQLLVENNVWEGTCSKAIYSKDSGYAVARNNDYGSCNTGNSAPTGSLSSMPYSYSLTSTSSVKSTVQNGVGPNMTF